MKSCRILSVNLKRFRDKYGISQEELAGRSNLSTRAYGEIERGRVHTTLDGLSKLAMGTGLTPSQLIDENLDLSLYL